MTISSKFRHDIMKLKGSSFEVDASHDGRIGKVIEAKLNAEQCLANVPDREGIEIKTHSLDSTALITLAHGNGQKLRTTTELLDANGNRSIHARLRVDKSINSESDFAKKCKLVLSDTHLQITHTDLGLLYQWPLVEGTARTASLRETIEGKLRSLLYIGFFKDHIRDKLYQVTPAEFVLFDRFSWPSFMRLLNQGVVAVEIDISASSKKDRSIKFRVPANRIKDLFWRSAIL